MKLNPVNKPVETIRYCFLMFCKQCGWAKHVIPEKTDLSHIFEVLQPKKDCDCEGETFIMNVREDNNYEISD